MPCPFFVVLLPWLCKASHAHIERNNARQKNVIIMCLVTVRNSWTRFQLPPSQCAAIFFTHACFEFVTSSIICRITRPYFLEGGQSFGIHVSKRWSFLQREGAARRWNRRRAWAWNCPSRAQEHYLSNSSLNRIHIRFGHVVNVVTGISQLRPQHRGTPRSMVERRGTDRSPAVHFRRTTTVGLCDRRSSAGAGVHDAPSASVPRHQVPLQWSGTNWARFRARVEWASDPLCLGNSFNEALASTRVAGKLFITISVR